MATNLASWHHRTKELILVETISYCFKNFHKVCRKITMNVKNKSFVGILASIFMFEWLNFGQGLFHVIVSSVVSSDFRP